MDKEYLRSCLRSDRPPIEIPEFRTTYQRTRVVVNLAVALSVVALNSRFDNAAIVVPGMTLLTALVFAHAGMRRRSGLVEMVSVDTYIYLAMVVLIDLPEVAAFVVITQSFLVFFHVRARTGVILTATYVSGGLVVTVLTIVTQTQRRTVWETALIIGIVTLLTTIPAAWMLSQAAAAMYLHRDKEESLSREKDELLVDKDRFVASVSHELRTPLTAVVGLAHTLAGEGDGFSELERAEFVALIVEQSEEVASIVDDLLVAARAGTGHLSLVVGEVDIAAELEAVVPDTIEIHNAEDTPILVVGDPIRIRQVLRNLTSNCLRYGGEVKRVRVFREGFTGVVSVDDDGRPIPENQVNAIFTAYGRAHDRPGRTDSVGLGLTVSRQLARMMGGDVTYSHHEGWTSFEFRLPMAMKDLTEAMYAAPESARMAHCVVAK